MKGLSGLSSRIAGVRMALTTTMFDGGAGVGERVGEREGPGLGGGLGGAVGGVRAVGLLGLGRGDEDEAPALMGDRVVEGARGVLDGADEEVVEPLVVVEGCGGEGLAALPAADEVDERRRPCRSAR